MARETKTTIVFKRVWGQSGEHALQKVLTVLYQAGLENDANDDVVSIRESANRPPNTCFDITVRVTGI